MTKRKAEIVSETKSMAEIVSETKSMDETIPGPVPPRESVRRFTGAHSLTHEGTIYQAGPDGVLELPEGDTWYHALVESGVLIEEVSHE